MEQRSWVWVFLQWGLWQFASGAFALVLINRWLLHWVDGPVKSIAIASVGVLTIATSIWAAFQSLVLGVWVPSLVLTVFACGEVRRVWLRYGFRPEAESRSGTIQNRTNMITTTDLRVHRHSMNVPSYLANLRIVHLTDLHINDSLPMSYFERVIATVREEAPGMILMTGDFISKPEYLPLLRMFLSRLPKVPFGTFAVLGNHDYWSRIPEQIQAELNAADITLLAGKCQAIGVSETKRTILCGIEGPWGPSAPFPRSSSDDLVIALSHTPDNVYEWSKQSDLMFAGHYHGGQLRLPGIGALVVPSMFGRRFDVGHFKVNRTDLFVSSGIGVDRPSLRLFCSPEILVVDLKDQ